MIKCYSNYCKRMKLNPEDERDLIQSIDYLNRTKQNIGCRTNKRKEIFRIKTEYLARI